MRDVLESAGRERTPLHPADQEEHARAEAERHDPHAERRNLVERDAHGRPGEAPRKAEPDQHQLRGHVGGLLLWNWHGQCLGGEPEWPRALVLRPPARMAMAGDTHASHDDAGSTPVTRTSFGSMVCCSAEPLTALRRYPGI